MSRKDPHDVILGPVVSEKSYGLMEDGKYTFKVARDANKVEIRLAVEEIFKVRVTGVNTLNRTGKRKRTRNGWGQRPASKRAVVTVAGDDRIDIFGGPVG